jgi:hypothetical protein
MEPELQLVGLWFGKCFVAPDAAITLDDAILVFETAKLLRFAVAAMTCHLTFRGQDLNFACIVKDTQL